MKRRLNLAAGLRHDPASCCWAVDGIEAMTWRGLPLSSAVRSISVRLVSSVVEPVARLR